MYLIVLPLVFLASCNLWYGTAWNRPLAETVCYIGSMCCVGFLEELIFRGFLFRALEREGVVWAVWVSSITFGLGHIINLFNGSGAELLTKEVEGVTTVVDAMVAAGVAKSKGEARRLIEQGGVSVDEDKVTDVNMPIPAPSFVLHKGKKVHLQIVVK
jgi:uncharacterized protein (DUF697 family)